MPRLTVITHERVYKDTPERYAADPGAYRGPLDFCAGCYARRDLTDAVLKAYPGLPSEFVREQLQPLGLAFSEGHLADAHPSYEGEDYRCAWCAAVLTADDD